MDCGRSEDFTHNAPAVQSPSKVAILTPFLLNYRAIAESMERARESTGCWLVSSSISSVVTSDTCLVMQMHSYKTLPADLISSPPDWPARMPTSMRPLRSASNFPHRQADRKRHRSPGSWRFLARGFIVRGRCACDTHLALHPCTFPASRVVLVLKQCAVCGPTLLYALYAFALALKEILTHATLSYWLVTFAVFLAVPALSLRTVMWPDSESE